MVSKVELYRYFNTKEERHMPYVIPIHYLEFTISAILIYFHCIRNSNQLSFTLGGVRGRR